MISSQWRTVNRLWRYYDYRWLRYSGENPPLRLLCFRGGFSLKGISSEESLSGGDILNKLKEELGVSVRELKISPEDTYTLCTLSLRKHSSFMEWMGDLLRPYIGGTLLVTPS